ncbi:MAG: RDD family protein [Candidatus Woesearchaeota archaeon]|nr:RDD family protein [Candidatus Woesearchaeota archaeon]
MAVQRGIKSLKQKILISPANSLKRALAFVLDLIIIDFTLFFPFRRLFQKMFPNISSMDFSSIMNTINDPSINSFLIAVSLSMGALVILYFALFEYMLQQTPGKTIMNIFVINVSREKDGKEAKIVKERLKLWQCILRNVFLLPIFPFFVLWIADITYIFFNRNRQRLLEAISKTMTVEARIGFVV